ncbi:uncharacterized protein LOC62_02G002701 [Vanrija pseudolonga]|uniref:Uncharacterized protein n=1 Tax=Vanrija pseudolonga TaxID=143232 RepID=A0AAF1BGQ6_9TREE|nr:hypothetical protein LOC62_02G002701 [Vanrija pseudolonga]
MSTTGLRIPILQLNFANGTTPACIEAVCGWSNTTECGFEPREVEAKLKKAIDAKACPSDRSFVKIDVTGMYKLFANGNYCGTCTFSSAPCASAVCGLQRTAVNATDGKSTCFSDPAIADAAVAGQYWFATNATVCKDDKPACKGFDDYVKAGSQTTSGAVVNISTSAPLAILAITTGLIGLLGACGFSIA